MDSHAPNDHVSGVATHDEPIDRLVQAKHSYTAGMASKKEDDPRCTKLFFDSVTSAWQVLEVGTVAEDARQAQALRVYHASLAQLVASAQQFEQLGGRSGLQLDTATGAVEVPVQYHNFAWWPEDFNQWIPTKDDARGGGVKRHRRDGWGVPMVVLRKRQTDERFFHNVTPFAATVLLRRVPVDESANEGRESEAKYVLDVYNPLVTKTIVGRVGSTVPMAADLSAPIEWLGQNAGRANFKSFLHPDQVRSRGQLIMMEPYQRGKTPVIFVHGLASDPLTWAGLINELRGHDWFNERYQVWVFGYSSGRPFLRSAADLRHECNAAVASLPGSTSDPALSHSVLIGHSMGGLVAKLQVSHSDTTLWDSFATRPFEAMNVDPKMRKYMVDMFFFQPLPFVERVVFIATPHGGSPAAEKFAGRVASRLVKRDHYLADKYAKFLKQNRAAVVPFFGKYIPTSVDMLEPRDPCLQAMRKLHVSPDVRMHSIIGDGRRLLIGGPADGVVPVESARHADVDSELVVHATHRRVQSHPNSVSEVARILKAHAQESIARDAHAQESIARDASMVR